MNNNRIRIFIDFWNFQLDWIHLFGKSAKIDWTILPKILSEKASQITQNAQLGILQYEEVRVYASCNPAIKKDRKLRHWFNNFLDRQPGFRVFVRERKTLTRPIHCRECDNEIVSCPKCTKPISRAIEKGVDSAIITDLFSLAWENAYDVAILVSNDADFIPAVERIQEKGLKIINATWRKKGFDLAKICWASFHLDDLTDQIKILRAYPNNPIWCCNFAFWPAPLQNSPYILCSSMLGKSCFGSAQNPKFRS